MDEQNHNGVGDEPPSPLAMSPVQLKDCIEPLLHFTLTSCVNESLRIALSKEYCSNLLKDDEDDRSPSYSSTISTLTSGVPPYPLYRHLASALCELISSGAVYRTNDQLSLMNEDSSMKQNACAWNKIIMEKGSSLVKMLETLEFELHVQEPYFSQLQDGMKTVEGRCAVGNYNRIESGAMILFNKCLSLQVQGVHWYPSFYDMLASEGLAKVLPGVETIREGVQIYRNFYSEEKERSKGVLAIYLKKPTLQLYDHLVAILEVLGYDGIQRLLGLAHTVGTIPEALPPPRSTLLSAFLLPHNPDVKSSVLTVGARALAKHVNRSDGKFWGSFIGNESQKNAVALDVINHLITHCCWLNVHIVPPHGVVFEIRVHDGYGARWSSDGTKFIGFLEPYMEDGHAKGWNH